MPFLKIFLLWVALLLPHTSTSAESTDGLPREVTINGVELVLIPSGWFWYTVNLDTSKLPVGSLPYRTVRVWLDGFYLAKFEARASDQLRFMNSGAATAQTLARQAELVKAWEDDIKHKLPDCTLQQKSDGNWALMDPIRDLPATNLTWTLAHEFATWMGFRLPTEAEWEKGARGTDRRIWPWGNTYPDDTYGRFGWSGVACDPATVDAFPRGRSPYGLYNMAGNVGEYVADWVNQDFDDALKDGVRNPPLATLSSPKLDAVAEKVSKGGVWTTDATSIRIETRRHAEPYWAQTRDGVRFAADVATVRAYLARGAETAKEKQ